MSTTSYLLIRTLETTVPDSFINPAMRDNFREMTNRCRITQRLTSGDFSLPPSDDTALIPVAYNLLIDALNDPSLLKRLQANSRTVNYWFFNIFTIPPGLLISPNVRLGVIKGKTQGLDQII